MGDSSALLLLLVWVACIYYGATSMRKRGRPMMIGALLGLFLGPVGLVIVQFVPDSSDVLAAKLAKQGQSGSQQSQQGQALVVNIPGVQSPSPQTAQESHVRKCPFCAETIQAAAIVCRYCGRDLEEKSKMGGQLE